VHQVFSYYTEKKGNRFVKLQNEKHFNISCIRSEETTSQNQTTQYT